MTDVFLPGLPLQFIEGINEGAEYDDKYVSMQTFKKFAIEYQPTLNYCLFLMNICIMTNSRLDDKEIKLIVYSDYHYIPGLPIREGIIHPHIDKEKTSTHWYNVEFEKPVVLVSDKSYWLVIDCDKRLFGLPYSNSDLDVECKVMVMKEEHWHSPSAEYVPRTRFMFQFFGKILPVT